MFGYYLLAGLLTGLGLWNLTVAILGCFPRCRRTAVGTLTKVQSWKNVKTRSGSIPVLTKYRYVYTVKNKTYAYTCEARHPKRRLFPKATMVYVVGFPRRAYLNKFTGFKEWFWGFDLLLIGILFLIALLRE